MAARRQLTGDFARVALLEVDVGTRVMRRDPRPWPVERGLRIGAVVPQGERDLHVALRLHEAAHHPEAGGQRAARGGGEGWNDGVEGPLARGERVRMRRVEREVVAPV